MNGRRKLNTIVTDDIMQEIDRRAAEQQDRTRAVLNEAGRPDLVQQLNDRLREVANGVAGARNVWHSLSDAQQRTMLHLANCGSMKRRNDGVEYTVTEPQGYGYVTCRLPTARKLCAHGLIVPDGGAFDPEAKFVLTERGRFVLDHGRQGSTQGGEAR